MNEKEKKIIRNNNNQIESNKNENESQKGNNGEKKEELEILIKKYNELRESFSKKINELEDFYEDNIEDVKVSNFEKARLRLKKLLIYIYENIINLIENSEKQKNIFIKENNNIFNKKITRETKKKIMENNISLEKTED